MEHTNQSILVKVSDLVPSPFNVRRHSHSSIEELAALIDSQGLLHSPTVHEHFVGRGKSRRLAFGVSAGERRRRALRLLQERGKLPADHEVACKLIAVERAREVSVAENSGREPMHPADEFEAFKALVDEGKGIEDVAVAFGVSLLTVQRRLKLAAVSPKLLALYREDDGKINLDQLMALAITDDHAAQERAWFGAHEWDRTPAALKRRLTAGEVEAAGNALVRFVGIEAYESAGGIVRRDLFDDEQGRFLSDPDLLTRLASDKLDRIAASVREEGWGWVEARIELDSMALRQFAPCEHTLRKPTADEMAELAALAQREAELEQESDALEGESAWNGADAERIGLEGDDIEARRRAIQEAFKVWPAAIKSRAGVIVTVNREGDTTIIRGLLREADRRALEASQRRTRKDVAPRPEEEAADAGSKTSPSMRTDEGLSEALTRRLAAQRTAALQAALAGNVQVALASLANTLLRRVLTDDYGTDRPAMQINATASAHALLSVADDIKGSRAFQAVEDAKARWRERLPAQRGEWFGWLVELPQPELLDLLGVCAALTVNALPGVNAARDADAVARAVGLDMAEWWEPTAAGFLNHVSKAQIVQALKEAGPDLARDGVEGMKKDVLVNTAAGRLRGTRWLPAALRPPGS
ncbi:MAG: ParB/Srx family N-terminal domain-containing protein [Burkholderiaceae bacterium]